MIMHMRYRSWRVFAALLLLSLPAVVAARPLRPSDIQVADGFQIEAAVTGLAAPDMVAFDEQGRMLIAETGYGGSGDPQVSRIEPDGSRTILMRAQDLGTERPLTAVAAHRGIVYVVHAGTVSTVDGSGQIRTILSGLPGQGDHQANQLVFDNDTLYLSIGTVTNAAVVGPDNAVFGWLKVPQNRQLHDVPCQDITLTDQVFETENPLGDTPGPVRTSAYAPFGTTLPAGATVAGNPKCNGAVLRANLDGSNLSVVAWGMRNPYGLERGPDGALYVTMHGFDARGARPVEDAWDCLYKIQEGAWYGWPDYACGVPVTDPRFKPADKPQPQFLIANHPGTPPQPLATFSPHAATNGFAFAPTADWGQPTDAFVALFGDFTPATGTVPEPQGVKIVRVNTTTGAISDFISNKIAGEASKHNAGGLEHPSDVTFGPDGAMYIADWGVARISVDGLKLDPQSGVVWKVTRGTASGVPGGATLLGLLLATLILAGVTLVAARGGRAPARPGRGLWAGALAGLLMGGFMMLISTLALQLPWYAPPRVLATMVLGRSAVANILDFVWAPFLIGLVVLLALTALLGLIFAGLLRPRTALHSVIAGLLFGLTFWMLLQHFVGPWLFPLVSDKGFPPLWYAISFALYGVILGLLLSRGPAARVAADAE
jgi:glucose/arabinose dehydrogenase